MTRFVTTDGVILRRMCATGQRLALIVMTAVAALVARPAVVDAHEIPSSVIVRMTVTQDSSGVRVVVRVPLESIRDIDFPLRPGTPYVDLRRADSLLGQAAETWIQASMRIADGGLPIAGRLGRTRLTINGTPVAAEAAVPVQSLSLEAEIDYPASSPGVTIEPSLARLGVRTRSVVTFRNLDGSEQMFEYLGDPGVL